MVELLENQILVYKRKKDDKKTAIFKKRAWGNWRYIAQLPGMEKEDSSLKKLALTLSNDWFLIEKFGGCTNIGKLEVITDYSSQHNKVSFNGLVYYQESHVEELELLEFYRKLNNFLFDFQQRKKELNNLIPFESQLLENSFN